MHFELLAQLSLSKINFVKNLTLTRRRVLRRHSTNDVLKAYKCPLGPKLKAIKQMLTDLIHASFIPTLFLQFSKCESSPTKKQELQQSHSNKESIFRLSKVCGSWIIIYFHCDLHIEKNTEFQYSHHEINKQPLS